MRRSLALRWPPATSSGLCRRGRSATSAIPFWGGGRSGGVEVLDLLAAVLLIAVLTLGAAAAGRLYDNMRGVADPSTGRLVGLYGRVLAQMNRDLRLGRRASVASEGRALQVETLTGTTVTYAIEGSSLVRSVPNGQRSELLSGLRRGWFAQPRAMLVEVCLYPDEAGRVPFFTGFALRGWRP